MIKTGSDILFQEPTSETRRLRRSTVVAAEDGSFSIQFVAEPFAFEADQEVLMYFNGKREFMQQVGRVAEVVPADEPFPFRCPEFGSGDDTDHVLP